MLVTCGSRIRRTVTIRERADPIRSGMTSGLAAVKTNERDETHPSLHIVKLSAITPPFGGELSLSGNLH